MKGINQLMTKLASLYFTPSKFFASYENFSSSKIAILCSFLYGVGGVLEQVENKSLQFNLHQNAESPELVLNLMVTYWTAFWGFAMLTAIISGALIWYVGGWFYNIRLFLCGAREIDKDLGRKIYVVANTVYAIPLLILLIVATFFYDNYLDFYASDQYLLLIAMLFYFWGLITSYKGVVSNFAVNKWLAGLFFIVGPAIVSFLISMLYVYLGMLG